MQVEARWLKGFSIASMLQKGYRAMSAGIRPISQISPLSIQVMEEVVIHISEQKSKIITEDMIKSSEKSINIDCISKSECPMLFINHVVEWGIEGPKGQHIEKAREISDDIKKRVKQIAESLQSDSK